MGILFSTKRSRWYFAVVALGLLMIATISDEAYECGDVVFLYNRASQMLSCIKDGSIPWFYYNDFNGAGYGTPFFYGQLLLYPFLPFVSLGVKGFTNLVILVSVVLMFFSVEQFVSKYWSDNVEWLAFIYTFGVYSWMHFVLNFLIWCNIGVAIAIWFFAECIAFFRDGKSYIYPSILYFVLLNTHTLSALWGFIGCVLLFFYYKGWKQCWLKFFISTVLMCLYTLSNMVYHVDSLGRLEEINRGMLIDGSIGNFCASVVPFGGYLYKKAVGAYAGYSICDFITLGFLIVEFCRVRLRYKVISLACFIGLFIGVRPIWESIMSVYCLRSQFPVRFAPFLLLILYVLLLRLNKPYKRVVLMLVLLPSLMFGLASSMSNPTPKNELYLIGKGEYLPKGFSIDYYNVVMNNSEGYSLNRGVCSGVGGGVYPRIYYKGYQAVSGKVSYNVVKDDGGFCYVEAPDDVSINLEYIHPMWLRVLFLFSYSYVILGGYCVTRKERFSGSGSKVKVG